MYLIDGFWLSRQAWSGGAAPGFSLDRAGLEGVIADNVDVVECNKNFPWSIPADSLLGGNLGTEHTDDTVRNVAREMVYMKATTVPSMWEGKGAAESEFASPVRRSCNNEGQGVLNPLLASRCRNARFFLSLCGLRNNLRLVSFTPGCGVQVSDSAVGAEGDDA